MHSHFANRELRFAIRISKKLSTNTYLCPESDLLAETEILSTTPDWELIMMRPQDIIVLLAIANEGGQPWLAKDIAWKLGISGGEVSESLRRSKRSSLYDPLTKQVNRPGLYEFLVHGLRYVFPQQPGAVAKGVPTTTSAAPLDKRTQSQDRYVWPSPLGSVRGFAVEPLYPSVPEAALRNPELHALFSLTDTIRSGRTRDRELARQELEKRLLSPQTA